MTLRTLAVKLVIYFFTNGIGTAGTIIADFVRATSRFTVPRIPVGTFAESFVLFGLTHCICST